MDTFLLRNDGYQRNKILLSPNTRIDQLFTPSATQKFALGTVLEEDNGIGRRWRYCKAGEGLSAAYCTQSAVGTANWQNQAQTYGVAMSVGDKEVTINLAATATKNQFQEGYLTIEDGTGEGQMYIIASNKAGVADATSGYDIDLVLADSSGIRVATVASSSTELTVTLNKYMDVIVFPTNPTGVATGVPNVAVTDDYYFWAQTKGPCAVVVGATDTIVVGDACGVATATTAGAACLLDAAAEGDVLLGYVMRAAATGETALIDLHLEA